MKSICFVTASFYPSIGGVETYVLHLAKKMQQHGYRIYIITSQLPKVATFEIYDNLHIYRFPALLLFSGRLNTILPSRRLYSFLKETILSEQAHIITNTRFYLSTILCIRFAHKHHLTAIHIEHGSGHIEMNGYFLNLLGRIYDHILGTILQQNLNQAYGVSRASSQWLKHFGIISNGELVNAIDEKGEVSNSDFRSHLVNSNDILISYVGRITDDKGYRDLIDAFLLAYKSYPRMKLLIAGNGPQFEGMCSSISGYDHILALGAVPHQEVVKLLLDSDIFVFPSKCKEGMPTTVLEAGLMKCAIIATPQGGVPEVIEPEVNGLIVNPGDVMCMADSILSLVNHPDLIIQYGIKIHEKIVSQFIWTNVANKLDKVLLAINANEK